jgi:hypothetical protein
MAPEAHHQLREPLARKALTYSIAFAIAVERSMIDMPVCPVC